jgi:hypothetical protein
MQKPSGREIMYISGTETTMLKSYLLTLMNGQTTPTPSSLALPGSDLGALPYQKESLHVELTLKDGSRLSIDYEYEGIQKKTSSELSRYADYTYGNDLFSPENTAKRILDFASSLWDGSEEKLNLLSDAIDKGLDQARKALGSIPAWLETIIGKTEILLHKGLEDMKAEIKKVA